MNKTDEALKLALEALLAATPVKAKDPQMQAVAIVALQEALAAPTPEPFGWWFTPNGEFLLPTEVEVDNPRNYKTYRAMFIDTPPAAQPAPVQEPVGEVSGHDWSTGLLYRDLEPGTHLYTASHAIPEQMPVIPKCWSLIAVTGFDELMYWMQRCEEKGHLENCPDLIEPYQAFDYQPITTPPAAQRQWVGLTPDEVEECVKYCRSADGLARAIEAKLKEKNT
jgi:hypothetical protein